MTEAVKRPNFLFLGPERAGAIWLHQVLQAHPQVFVPFSTDFYFFDHYYYLGEDWYLEHFKQANSAHRVVGEVSRRYLVSADAPGRIIHTLPSAQLMVCLREPVDRSFSAWLDLRSLGALQTDFARSIDEVSALVDDGLYAKHLSRYFDLFGHDRIHTPLFDDLEADPNAFAQDLFAFLGVDPFPLSEKLKEPVNVAGEPRNRGLARFVSKAASVTRRFGAPDYVAFVKSSRVVHRALYRPYPEGQRPTLDPELRERLKERFREDVHELASMTGIDVISRWGY